MIRIKTNNKSKSMNDDQETSQPESKDICQIRRRIEEHLEKKRYREEQVFAKAEYEVK